MASERKKTALEAEMTLDASKVKDGSKTAVEALKDIQVQGEAMGASVQKSLDGAGQAAKGVAAGVNAAADQTAAAVEKLDRQTASLSRSIRRATAENLAGGRNTPEYFTELGKLQGANIAAISRDFERLAESRKIADQAALSLDKMGLSAKQTAAALRQVPAQFTDIVVSLQGGQNPLTVLLQQGGQLKDVFGGAGNALRAMGGYIAGLISPVTIAGAGIATLAAGFLLGRRESEAFTKNLILTGSAAGVTAGQLSDMAAAIDRTSDATQGQAAEALRLLSSSGAVAASSLERFSKAAVEFDRVGGQSVEKTAEAFADLGRAPLSATLKLNESMNYLTRSTYEQIKALEEQGSTVEAASVAQNAYADAINERTPQIRANLGLVEQAWKAIVSAGAAALDAIKEIGRDGPTRQIAALESQLASVRRLQGGGGLLDVVTRNREQEILKELEGLRYVRDAEEAIAKARGESAKQIKARAEFDKDGLQFLSKEEQYVRAVVKARNEGLAAGASEVEIAKRILDIKQKTFSSDKPRSTSNSEAEKELDLLNKLVGVSSTFNNELDILRQRYNQNRDSAAGYAEKVKKLLELQPFAVKQAKELAEAEKLSLDNRRKETEAREKFLDGLKKETEAVEKNIAGIEEEIAQVGLSKSAIAERVAVRLEELAVMKEVLAVASEGEGQFGFAAEYKRTADALRAEADAKRRLASAVSTKEISESIQKSAEDARREWLRTFEDIGRGLADALIEGGQSAVNYLRNLFRNLVLRPIVQTVIAPVTGLLAGVLNPAMAADGSGGGGSSVLGTANTLYGAYNNFSTGFSNVGAMAANYYGQFATSQYGQALGLSTFQQAGLEGGFYANPGVQSAFGSVASYGAGAAAGIYGGRAISAGYSAIGSSGNTAVNAGTIIGAAMAGPIGAAVGGIIGGVVNRAFGRRAPEVEGRALTGTFSGSGDFSGDLVTTILERGGWFRSDRRSELADVISGDLDKALDEGGQQIAKIAQEYGKVLGLPVERLSEVTQQIRVTITDDLDANSKAIQDALTQYGNTLLEAFSPELEPLRRSGETIAQTIERVGGSLKGVNSVLDALGIKALEASVNGAQAALALEGLFGGIQGLQSAASTYFDRFFSAEEKFKVQQTSLSKVFDDLGKTLPNSRDEFKKLVDAQDLTTESGRQTFAALLSVAGAFDQLIVAADAAAEAARELKRQDIQAQMDALQRAVGDFSILEPTRNLSQQLSDGRNRLQELESGLAEILGTVTESIQETLARLVNGLRALREYRSGLAGSIQDARIAGMDPAGRIAALRAQEAGLFSELGTATDPVAVAQKLQETIIRRIQEESALRQQAFDDTQAQIKRNRDEQISALRSQITAAQRLQDLAASIAEFNASLRSSDLSPLSFADQLKASQGLFESTLAGAARGDANAQSSLTSNAKAYLDEARAYFGASSAYNDIFQRVTASLDALGSNAPASPQIAILEQQLAALESLNSTQEALAQDNTSLVESLTGLDLALAAREKRDEQAVADAKAAADAQIAEQRAINENLTAQITQAAAAYAALKAELETLNANVGTLVQNANLETVKP